jgi:hypothetical protein
VAVDIDEPRCDSEAGSVELAAVRRERPDRRDETVLDADVGDTTLRAGAVVDGAAPNDEVEAQYASLWRVALPSSTTTP